MFFQFLKAESYIVIQKNPGAIRHPEEEKAEETIQMDALLDLEQTRSISPYIAEVCKDARDLTYVRENDLNVLSKGILWYKLLQK